MFSCVNHERAEIISENHDNGGIQMKIDEKKIYSELRVIKMELQVRLEKESGSSFMKKVMEEELRDIERTLERIVSGYFGYCELTGETIPQDLLMMVPTITTMGDINIMDRFYCKPIGY